MSYPYQQDNQPANGNGDFNIRIHDQQPNQPAPAAASYPPVAPHQQPSHNGSAEQQQHAAHPAATEYAYYPTAAQHNAAYGDNQFARRVMSGGAHVIVAGITLFFLLCFIIGALASGVPFGIVAAVIGAGIFIMLEIYGIVTFVRGIIVHSLPQIISGAAIVVTCLALPILFYLMIIFSALRSISNYYPSSNPYNPYGP